MAAVRGLFQGVSRIFGRRTAEDYFKEGESKPHAQDEEAIIAFSEAIRLKPDYAKAYEARGDLKHRLGRYQEALADYTQVIRLQPDGGYYNRGRANNSLGRYEEAIADYTEAIRLKSGDGWAYSGRANAYLKLRRYEEAIMNFNQAIRLGNTSYFHYNNRGRAKYKLGCYEEAIEDYTKALKNPYFGPTYGMGLNNRGIALYALGRYDEAVRDHTQAICIHPDDTAAYHARGKAKHGLGHYEEAIVDFDAAIRLKSDDAKTYYNRGSAKEMLNRYEEAILDYDSALRLKPGYAKALESKRLLVETLAKSAAAASEAGAGAANPFIEVSGVPTFEESQALFTKEWRLSPHEEAIVDYDAEHPPAAAAAAGAGAVVASPTTDMSELELTLEECKALIARQSSFALRDELELRASRVEVLPAIVLAQQEAKRQAEQKWLAEHPELDDYYHVFKNMLCATLTGAMGIYAGMVDSSAASALESKLQKGAKYFSKLFKFLPFVKDATAPLQAAIDKAISISHENKVTHLLRCFPDFDQAPKIAEELARGIALAMREAIDRPSPSEGYRLVRALKRYASTAKRRAKNLFYVNNLDTPIKQRAYEDVQKVLLLMMDETTLTKDTCTVEHIVTTHLIPGEVLLPSPIAGADATDATTATTVTVMDGSSGGTASAEQVIALQELFKAEQQRRLELEERLKRIEADRKKHTDREVRAGSQALTYAAAEAADAAASHAQEFARIHTELGQHRDAISELAVRTGGGVRPLEAHVSAIDPLERAQLLGTAPIDAAAVTRTISAKDHHTLGMRKYLNGRYQAAIEDFNAAITSNPNYALTYYNRGRAYFALKQNTQALADFTEALRLKPDFIQANRAKVLIEGFRS